MKIFLPIGMVFFATAATAATAFNYIPAPAPAANPASLAGGAQAPVASDPVLAQKFIDQGALFLREENYDAAIAEYSKALQADASSHQAYFFRGYAYRQQLRLREAIGDYDEAIRLKPDDAVYQFSRCNANIRAERFDEAIVDCTEAIRLSPTGFNAYFHRGLAYWLKSSPEEIDRAMADTLTALMIVPKDPNALRLLDEILAKKAMAYNAVSASA